jgi:hypothetical protein
MRGRKLPACRKLLSVLREKINFQWSEWTLVKVLKEIGFRWKKCSTKRRILIEKQTLYIGDSGICSPLKNFEKKAEKFST